MPRFLLAVAGLGILVVLSAACEDQGPGRLSCDSEVSVTVTRGKQPIFDWMPACRIHVLTVAEAGSGAVVWGAISLQANSIVPAVQYGVAPPGAALTAEVQLPLSAGTTYRVTLFRVQDGRTELRELGEAIFLP